MICQCHDVIAHLYAKAQRSRHQIIRHILRVTMRLVDKVTFITDFREHPHEAFPIRLAEVRNLMVSLDTVLVGDMGSFEPLANILQCRHLILLHNGCVLKIPCDAHVRNIQRINQLYQFIRLAGVTLTGCDVPVPEVFDGDTNAQFVSESPRI